MKGRKTCYKTLLKFHAYEAYPKNLNIYSYCYVTIDTNQNGVTMTHRSHNNFFVDILQQVRSISQRVPQHWTLLRSQQNCSQIFFNNKICINKCNVYLLYYFCFQDIIENITKMRRHNIQAAHRNEACHRRRLCKFVTINTRAYKYPIPIESIYY